MIGEDTVESQAGQAHGDTREAKGQRGKEPFTAGHVTDTLVLSLDIFHQEVAVDGSDGLKDLRDQGLGCVTGPYVIAESSDLFHVLVVGKQDQGILPFLDVRVFEITADTDNLTILIKGEGMSIHAAVTDILSYRLNFA